MSTKIISHCNDKDTSVLCFAEKYDKLISSIAGVIAIISAVIFTYSTNPTIKTIATGLMIITFPINLYFLFRNVV